MSEQIKPSYWAVLPASVRYDPAIPSTAKLLYAEISALADKSGYCFAGNEYLAELFGISDRTVRRLIKSLADGGYIIANVERDETSNEVITRSIYVGINPVGACTPPDKNVRTPPDKNVHTSGQKCQKHILDNNNIIHGQTVSDPVWRPERFNKLWQFYPRQYRGHRKRAVAAWDKLKLPDATIDEIARALQKQMQSDLWKRGVGIPHLSTYLNGEYWTEADDLAPAEEAQDEGWADDPEVL